MAIIQESYRDFAGQDLPQGICEDNELAVRPDFLKEIDIILSMTWQVEGA